MLWVVDQQEAVCPPNTSDRWENPAGYKLSNYILLGTNYPTIYYWVQTIQRYSTGHKLSNYTTIYNPTMQGGVQLHGHLKIHIVQLLHFRPRVVPYGRYVLPDQLKKNIQHSDPCWRSSKGKSLGWVTEKMLQHPQPACPDWLLLGQRIHHHYHQVHHIHLPHHHSSAFTTSAASIRVFLGISDIISFLEVLNQTWMSCMYLKNLMSGYTQYFGLTCKYRVYPK